VTTPTIPKVRLPGFSYGQMQSKIPNVTLNPDSFQSLIEGQGVRMIHRRPVPCPNIRMLEAPSHDAKCDMCYNGFIYYDEREFVGAAMGNTLDRRFGANGTWDMDQAAIIVPTADKSGRPMDVNYFDQIEMPDFTVRYYQRVEHSQSGTDRLQFPALSVDFLIDHNGKAYKPGVDFLVRKGRVVWVEGRDRPSYDPVTKRGMIYSVNYYTTPTFTVLNLPHQLRMAQTRGPGGGNNVQARFPQLAVVRRDFIPYDGQDHKGAPDRPEPRDGSF
jgi:hypothetical protein